MVFLHRQGDLCFHVLKLEEKTEKKDLFAFCLFCCCCCAEEEVGHEMTVLENTSTPTQL